jgi:LmbE family N-acetylglucosaminyl deacetylase
VSPTIVCFHAHPDDEALYTGGTMARLAAEGHRVVLVTATAGEAGLASSALTATESLGALRRRELAVSAGLLGCARVVGLGYPDSGPEDGPHPVATTFAAMDPESIARRVAEVLDEEEADVLTTYDPAGGYGHPDHRQVHRAGLRAAELAHTAVVLEATVDRRALQRALWAASWAKRRSPDFRPGRFDNLYTHPDLITHRVDVGAYLAQKRAAMQAHLSQTTADDGARSLAWFLRLPGPLFRLAFGREWFVEKGRNPTKPPLGDVLASLIKPTRGANHPKRI